MLVYRDGHAVYLTLARVGAEWIDEITAVCAEANARFAVAAADGKVHGLAVTTHSNRAARERCVT